MNVFFHSLQEMPNAKTVFHQHLLIVVLLAIVVIEWLSHEAWTKEKVNQTFEKTGA